MNSGGTLTSEPPTKPRRPTRFFGTVDLDTTRPMKSFETVLNAIVAELQRTPGAKVGLTLEIEAEAEAEDGFAEEDCGIVRDNAIQLKFRAGSTGFE